jgi:CelD/BcsL family acetyltransferase involved in cellulose biosynthesis
VTGVKTRVISDAEEFESLAETWHSLLQRTGNENSVYLTHEWLTTWWKHFGAGRQLNVLILEKEASPIGAVPLMRTDYRVGPIRRRFLETVGAVNRNYVWVVPPEHRDEVADTFRAYLNKELAVSGDALHLTVVPDDSSLLSALQVRQPEAAGVAAEAKATTIAPYTALPSAWDEFYRSLSQNRRKLLRRYSRSLEEAGDVEYQVCTDGSLEERLNRFYEIHEERWRSAKLRGSFADPRMKDFHSDLARRLLSKGWLHFSWISLDGEMVSAAYCFAYSKTLYWATSGRDIRYSRYGVGHVLEEFLIREAIELGLEEFDWLKGAEPYKFHWTKSARRYHQVLATRQGRGAGYRLQYIRAFLRLHAVRQYRPGEVYRLFRMQRREAEERKRMGLGSGRHDFQQR